MATPKAPSNPAATYSRSEATTATAAAGKPPRYPDPDATAPGGGEKTPSTRAQGCGAAALAQPLRRVTRSDDRRRGLRLALLRPSPPSSGLSQWAPAPCRQRKPINPSTGRPSSATTGAKAHLPGHLPSASGADRPRRAPHPSLQRLDRGPAPPAGLDA